MGSDTRASLVVYEHYAAGGAEGRGPDPAAGTQASGDRGSTETPGGAREAAGGLRAEGEAMLRALLEDLTAARPAGLELRAVLPEDAGVSPPPGVGRLPPRGGALPFSTEGLPAPPRRLLWPIAPETRGVLEDLVAAAGEAGLRVVGPARRGVRAASERARLLRTLEDRGLPVPAGGPAASPGEALEAAGRVGWPAVVKPGRGAGAEGVTRVDDAGGLEEAWRRALAVEPDRPPLVQALVEGEAASVCLLVEDGEPTALALNRQLVRFGPEARYRGGATPHAHPDREAALEAAAGACRAVPGLRGWVGVDLVLSPGGPVVIEVNPRLTTSYLPLRARFGPALAGRALAAGLEPGGAPVDAGARRAAP